MTEFTPPFDLEPEFVESEIAMLEEMAVALPMTAEIARQRIEKLRTNPQGYFDERAAEGSETNTASRRIMGIAGLDPDEYTP